MNTLTLEQAATVAQYHRRHEAELVAGDNGAVFYVNNGTTILIETDGNVRRYFNGQEYYADSDWDEYL